MADEIDIASHNTEILLASRIREIGAIAAKIPVGEPGECTTCGEDSQRLVGGRCAPCRDKLDRKRSRDDSRC